MQIIKKIDNEKSIESLNDSLRDLPCYGVCVQSKYNFDGNFTIKGIDGKNFVENVLATRLALNIHLFNERRLSEADYIKIAQILAQIKDLSSVILSSSQLSRISLNVFREVALEFQDALSSRIIVASNDDLSKRDIKRGDMMYSSRPKSKIDYEFDRLSEYIKGGVPVLLDWQDNNDKRISKMIERTNNSDNLIVLSKKPQTTRRILSNTIY